MNHDNTILEVETFTIVKAKLICLDDSLLPENQKALQVIIDKAIYIIGREEGNDLTIKTQKISKQHVKLFFSNNKWYVEDLGSTNGTFVNNKRVANLEIKHGDTINLASIPFRFELIADDSAKTADSKDKENPNATMYLNDDKAGQIIQNVMENKGKDKEPPPIVKPKKNPKKNQQEDENDAPSALGNFLKIAVVLIILLGFGGGGFYYYASIYKPAKEKETVVNKFNKKIKDLREKIEKYPAEFNSDAKIKTKIGIEEVNKIIFDINNEYTKYPKDTDIRYLESSLLFMALERKVHLAIDEDKIQEAVGFIKETQKKILNYIEDSSGNENSLNKIKEISELLKLQEVVLYFKVFQKNYSEEVLNKIDKDKDKDKIVAAQEEVIRLNNKKEDFINLKRNNNTVLMVNFGYFGGMVTEVEDKGLSLLYKWASLKK